MALAPTLTGNFSWDGSVWTPISVTPSPPPAPPAPTVKLHSPTQTSMTVDLSTSAGHGYTIEWRPTGSTGPWTLAV
jgi:hypothetical protein